MTGERVLKSRAPERHGITAFDKFVRLHRTKHKGEPYREIDFPLDMLPDLVEDLLDFLYPPSKDEGDKPDPWEGRKVLFRKSPGNTRMLHRDPKRPGTYFLITAPDSRDFQSTKPKRITNQYVNPDRVRQLYTNMDGSEL